MSTIYVIILNWNGKKDTLACLASLEQISHPLLKLIVVDNGSTDDSVISIKHAHPKVHLIETKENLGYAEGNNVGIRFALSQQADFILILNNDTIVDCHLVSGFLDLAEKRPDAGIFGGKIYLYQSENQLDHIGGTWNRDQGVFNLIGNREIDDGLSWELPKECDYVCGAALFVRRQVFEQVGLLEPRFFLIWEESDFCFRAKKAGWLTLYCPKALLWHKVSASFVGGKTHTSYFWWRNRLLWIERNCPKNDKNRLFWKIIIPKALQISKLFILKSLQYHIKRFLDQKNDLTPHKDKIAQYRASLAGILDYFLNRFGNGPAWIYTREKLKIKNATTSKSDMIPGSDAAAIAINETKKKLDLSQK